SALSRYVGVTTPMRPLGPRIPIPAEISSKIAMKPPLLSEPAQWVIANSNGRQSDARALRTGTAFHGNADSRRPGSVEKVAAPITDRWGNSKTLSRNGQAIVAARR